MTTTVTVPLALELAAASGRPPIEWEAAVAAVGGEERARWLLEHCGQRWSRMTPEALCFAHVVAQLLDDEPPSPP